jgi:hypothetical protein
VRTEACFTSAGNAVDYMLGGKATLTLVSRRTQARFTYRIRVSKDGRRYYVSVLTGSDNTRDYTFIGTIFPQLPGTGEPARFSLTSSLTQDTPSVRAFSWSFKRLARGELPEELEAWHEGRCSRCNRMLTTPESIQKGMGPECASKGSTT